MKYWHTFKNNSLSHFLDKQLVLSMLFSITLLLISFVVNFYAGVYADKRASSPVTDLILSNIPVFNVDMIFIYGPFVMWAFVALLGLWKPRQIPFIAKNIALFILIRSFFITLTHIGPFPTQIPIDYSTVIEKFTFGGDLFFSAHTGLPFLMALVFWKERWLRYTFITLSIFFGIIVLLGHLHYSIDVLAAFFITYSISHIAQIIFKKDSAVFETASETTKANTF